MAPPTIARDRFDYVNSVSESWKRQMLLNLLKTRYVDAPVSMDISSAINSYSVEGDVELGGEIAPVGQGDTFAGVGVTGRYADKPTISFVPLAGVFLIPIGSITLLNFPRFRSQPSGST